MFALNINKRNPAHSKAGKGEVRIKGRRIKPAGSTENHQPG